MAALMQCTTAGCTGYAHLVKATQRRRWYVSRREERLPLKYPNQEPGDRRQKHSSTQPHPLSGYRLAFLGSYPRGATCPPPGGPGMTFFVPLKVR